jgi:hypothetical protein
VKTYPDQNPWIPGFAFLGYEGFEEMSPQFAAGVTAPGYNGRV